MSLQDLFNDNIGLGADFIIAAFSINDIYGNGLMGFVALMALTFMDILNVLVANHGD
jgi:hypothetical protein